MASMTGVEAPQRVSRAASPGALKQAVAQHEAKENSVAENAAPLDIKAKTLKEETVAAANKTLKDEKAGTFHTRFGNYPAPVVLALVATMVAMVGSLLFFFGIPALLRTVARCIAGCLAAAVLAEAALLAHHVLKGKMAKAAKRV